MSEPQEDIVEQVRAAMRTRPPSVLGSIDVEAVIRAGRKRRRGRRTAAAGAAVTVLVIASTGLILGWGGPSAVPPAGTSAAAMSPAQRHAAWVSWADCLRQADIPGVTVTGPSAGSDAIAYRDEQGNPLPKDYRETNGEWGSATEFCAAEVPGLLPELEDQWGDLTTGPARELADRASYERCLAEQGLSRPTDRPQLEAAAAAGCAWAPYDPEAAKILECSYGHEQSGSRSIPDRGPWRDSPAAAGRAWLAGQQDREEFATALTQGGDKMTARLLIKSGDGRTTGIVYLLSNATKGWRLHGMNVCRPRSAP